MVRVTPWISPLRTDSAHRWWASAADPGYTRAVLSGRALALALLVWSLVKVCLARMLGERTGLALFHDNYDADRLPPVTPDERRALASFSRCIACGRCDLGEAQRIAASRGAYPGLMTIVLASARSMPDSDAAARALEHVPDQVLAEKEAICPTGVPFRELAGFVRAKAAFVAAATGKPEAK
jgi:hypothetical protein